MVNNSGRVTGLVVAYVGVAAGTLVALAVLSGAAPDLATDEAWGHAIVVAVFAVLLPLRLRAARRGSGRARWAVGIIAGVLLVANLVEAALPGVFPGWMRIEMLGIAALAALLLGSVAQLGWLRSEPAAAAR
jgi:hypothetical protein